MYVLDTNVVSELRKVRVGKADVGSAVHTVGYTGIYAFGVSNKSE